MYILDVLDGLRAAEAKGNNHRRPEHVAPVVPAERKARREYENRVNSLTATGSPRSSFDLRFAKPFLTYGRL